MRAERECMQSWTFIRGMCVSQSRIRRRGGLVGILTRLKNVMDIRQFYAVPQLLNSPFTNNLLLRS